MHFLLSLVLFLAWSYDTLAVPTPALHRHSRKSRSFRVERAKRSDYIAHGPNALRKAYSKFGIVATNPNGTDVEDFQPFDTNRASTASSNQNTADDSDQTGAVSATSVQDGVEFVSPVVIGGQNLTLDFDTGSADLWVMSSELPAPMRQGRAVYNPDKSTTYRQVQGGSFEISYGDSSYAAGSLGKETVSIGGAVVKQQWIGLASNVAQSFIEDTSSNGLVGLGFSSLNTFKPGPQKTFFENIAPNLDEPVFTARLREDGVGEYEFGIIDHSKYQGSLANVSVNSTNGFWEFPSASFGINDEPMQSIKDAPTAIADTGTTLMLVSADVAAAYYGRVTNARYSNGASGYIYPCNADLPSLSVAVGTQFKATIPGSLINYSEIGTNMTSGETCEFPALLWQYIRVVTNRDVQMTVCYGGIQSNSGSSLQIFGDIFLKSFFVVFDQRGPSLGIASPS
ncbi:aspergillopepsin A-like aspartic endopeptidase [Penicillium hispanicum]|uniref:aspergillopepsin A-like aspartic endopeptidase n=1 Tax=Penicillium hispanicum TaxID=1080232 RepID=UPI00253FA0A9|nr:aspergillopepsin A-like aspartic endopeptidase [Penicillium hispanicum]KAJ5587087.1 aspergillopepsin A-like aspartic endopeptidase [Penicillium hispanicum]